MRSLAEFVKTTLIGGLLIILPIYVSVILIAKAVQGIVAAMKPITAVVLLPFSSVKSLPSL
jgi:hypothetical protein